jgi:hypothetical protein
MATTRKPDRQRQIVGVEAPTGGCASWTPGHNLHVIQAQIALERPGAIGVLVAEGDEVYLLTDDAAIRLRSHRPQQLHQLTDRFSHLEWELTTGLIMPARRGGLSNVPAASVAAGDRELGLCYR